MTELVRMKRNLTDAAYDGVRKFIEGADGKKMFGERTDVARLDTNTLEVRFHDPFDGRRAIKISIR